jgi:hypothetical protein
MPRSPSSSSTRRRNVTVSLQALLGVAALIAWVLIDGLAISDASLIQGSFSVLPMFIAYELGVFSRFIPGLDWVAKRIK